MPETRRSAEPVPSTGFHIPDSGMIYRTNRESFLDYNNVSDLLEGTYDVIVSLGTALALGGKSSSMNELKTGLLMLLVCAAFYVLADPRVWGGLCQFVGRLVGGVN
jgi:hypothetical protein